MSDGQIQDRIEPPPDDHFIQSQAQRRKVRLIRDFGGACQKCGYNRCLRALQFHHKDSSEKDLWSKGSGNAARAEIRAHPERFMLLCANCHFEEHEAIDAKSLILANCLHCGRQFRTKTCLLEQGKGKYCTRRCQHGLRASTAPMTVAERFWKKVKKTDGCWLWTGQQSGGAGFLSVILPNGTRGPRTAARVSWELHHGTVPDGLGVIRRCGTERCVRPDHLFLGTRADLSANTAKLGRMPRGERSNLAVLTEEKVREIRRRFAVGGISQRDLGREFGVSAPAIGAIVRNRTWSHIKM